MKRFILLIIPTVAIPFLLLTFKIYDGNQQNQVNAVTTGFNMGKVDDPMMHSTRFVLVDQRRRIRGYYDANDVGAMDKLREDVSSLL